MEKWNVGSIRDTPKFQKSGSGGIKTCLDVLIAELVPSAVTHAAS